MSKKPKKSLNQIATNKKASHDYFFDKTFEAGIALEGWEIKSIREARVQLKESYIIIKKGEAFLIGCHISPLNYISSHQKADPVRTRKLLLHRKELNNLIGAVSQQGFTIVPVNLHWKKHLVKIKIALGKGKKLHDKRASAKEADWQRSKDRLVKDK
ncbi:MAG: SsrA-binding protein SmpB [Pseudomonadota bacterium]|nr:SsrA-binding protein SmpB [Pseudomonadota bacterium]